MFTVIIWLFTAHMARDTDVSSASLLVDAAPCSRSLSLSLSLQFMHWVGLMLMPIRDDRGSLINHFITHVRSVKLLRITNKPMLELICNCCNR